MWRALVGSGRLGSGCLVLHANTRENPGGKNGVMTPFMVENLLSDVPSAVKELVEKNDTTGGRSFSESS